METEGTQGAQVRRYQDTLATAGMGVIAFGAWSVVKTVLFCIFFDDDYVRLFFASGLKIPMVFIYVTAAVVLAIDLGLRCFVGLSARSESLGKRKGWAYLVAAFAVAGTCAANIVITVTGDVVAISDIDAAVSVVIDVTSLATLTLMVVSAVRLRRLTRAAG